MERREFVKLSSLAAIATVAGIDIVQDEEVFTISNRPHPDAVFTEESLRKALEEFRKIRYHEKMFFHAYNYRVKVIDWKGLYGFNNI